MWKRGDCTNVATQKGYYHGTRKFLKKIFFFHGLKSSSS